MEAATALGGLPSQLRARSFERECERLRPLGEAYVLRRFAGSLGCADAEDVVAEVLIRLHRLRSEGHPPDNLRAAFFTSVRNSAIDQLRARSVRPTVALEAAADAPSAQAGPAERAEGHEDSVRLQEALGRMRANYREVILLRFGLGMTVPEIAQHLQISLPAAKKLVLRATAQVRKRLESIEAAEFCPEMRELARRSLFEREASGLASEAEAEVLRAHLSHCGSCRSFLASLHGSLHDLGAAAVFGLFAAQRVGAVDHLARWGGAGLEGVQAGAAKLRDLAHRAFSSLSGSDGGPAGALMGTGQKIAAICSAGAATTATCLATGIVGPGIGVTNSPPLSRLHDPPAQVREATPAPLLSSEAPSSAAAPSSSASPPQQHPSTQSSGRLSKPSSEARQAKSETPTQQSQTQFGFEGSSPPSSAPSSASSSSLATPAPAPAPEPAPSPSPGEQSSGSSGSTESFGFQG